jgi:hypothetical protein
MTPLLLVLAATSLSFRIELPQERVLVGEPVKLVVRFEATTRPIEAVSLPFDGWMSAIDLYVHDGRSERRYVEIERGDGINVNVRRLTPGREVASNVVLFYGGYPTGDLLIGDEPLFGKPGEYRVRAEYKGPGSGVSDRSQSGLRSNEVRIRVELPHGAAAEILSFSRQNRLVLMAAGASDEQNQRTRELMAKHPDSPYLRWARLKSLSFLRPKEGGQRDRTMAELAKEILAFPYWGVFEEDALAQAYLFARNADATDLMIETRQRLLKKYPRSALADVVRDEPADPTGEP